MKKFTVGPKIKKNVKDYIQSAVKALNLQEWTIDTLYHKDEKKSNVAYDEGFLNVAGEMSVDRRYLFATLKLYPTGYNKTEEELKEIVFHEMSHIWTEHLKDLAFAVFKDEGETKDAWESLTSRISSLALGFDNRKS